MNLLLDTAVFLWLIAGCSPDGVGPVDRARSGPPRLVERRVLWEISTKQKLGRLELPGPASAYVTAARDRHAIESLGLLEPAIAHLAKLPDVHRDPFDRMRRLETGTCTTGC